MNLTDKLWKRILIVVTFPIYIIPLMVVGTIVGFSMLMWEELEVEKLWNWIKDGY